MRPPKRSRKEHDIAVAKFNVSSFEECEAGIAKVVADHGPIEILVNNAGITRDGTLLRMRRDMWDAVLDTNLGSCYNMCKLTFEGMRDRKFGRIVNVGSVNGQAGQYGQVNYAAAKSGIHGFTKALAQEGARTASPSTPSRRAMSIPRWCARSRVRCCARSSPRSRSAGSATPRTSPAACVPDRRGRRFRYWIDAVDQRRDAHVLTFRWWASTPRHPSCHGCEPESSFQGKEDSGR